MAEVQKSVPTTPFAPDPNVQPGYAGERGTQVLPEDHESGLVGPTGEQPQTNVDFVGNEPEKPRGASLVSRYNTNGSYL